MTTTHITPPPQLHLTGERHGKRYVVRLYSQSVAVTFVGLGALIEMLRTRAGPEPGFALVERLTIFRLRKAFDKAAGAGTGKALIETGDGEEYRLTIPRAELFERVAIEASFFDLERRKVINAEQAEALRRHYRVIEST